MKALGQAILITITFIVCMLWRGGVLSALWSWYLVPIGLKAISTHDAVGISLIVSFLTHSINEKDKDEPFILKWIMMLVHGMLWPLLALFGGWVMYRIA